MIDPEDGGAVAVIVNVADGADAEASEELNVTLHVSNAEAVFKFVQVTDDTPVPAVAAVAVTPVGN